MFEQIATANDIAYDIARILLGYVVVYLLYKLSTQVFIYGSGHVFSARLMDF